MTSVVFSDVAANSKVDSGSLFKGLKFWLSHKVPQRSRFINDIRVCPYPSIDAPVGIFTNIAQVNGGEILPIEKHADIKVVDHTRKEALPGTYVPSLPTSLALFEMLIIFRSYSYTFIEASVRKGALEDLQDHRAGPPEGTVRSIGSIIQPPKGTRNKFSQDDDRILWNWVHDNPQKGGGTDGNEIYKQLEAQVRAGSRAINAEVVDTQ